MGVLVPKDPNYSAMTYAVGSELVVEWRALTICLIDLVSEGVCCLLFFGAVVGFPPLLSSFFFSCSGIRATLGMTPDQLPLSRILEGGTWSAGRVAAKVHPFVC